MYENNTEVKRNLEKIANMALYNNIVFQLSYVFSLLLAPNVEAYYYDEVFSVARLRLRMPHRSMCETFVVKSNKKLCVELENGVVIIKEDHEGLQARL